MDLAHHRTSTCPEKIILCQFCHLLVPQQGSDDLSPTDPEVILSGLTPHELADGARTTECHLCNKIVRLRDMTTHLKHHDLSRKSQVRVVPRLCRNTNCGRTLDGVGPVGQINPPTAAKNDIGLCDICYGPLYNSAFDPDGKALRRRVERRYLTQFLTGCNKHWCRNEMCKTGRANTGLEPLSSKDGVAAVKPAIEEILQTGKHALSFCVDEKSQIKRTLADVLAADESGSGYAPEWCVAAVEASDGDLAKAQTWLSNWAPTRAETAR
jgi:hypothetical protein